MISDLKYDTELMDIVIENGDFKLNNSVSEQNGALILNTKNINIDFPIIGVGINDVLNSDLLTIKSYLNRWKSQVLQDGAISAEWEIVEIAPSVLTFKTTVAYE